MPKDDFPDPERPVMTTNFSLGISRETFFKLCSLALLQRFFSTYFFFKIIMILYLLINCDITLSNIYIKSQNYFKLLWQEV